MIVFPKGLTDKGTTPIWFMKKLDDHFHFELDPCPENWDQSFDGLKIDWKDINYCNPPYAFKNAWIVKAIEEQKKGKMTVFFLPVDTSTKWFNDLLLPNAMILFVSRRVKSNIGKTPAFSSLVAILYPNRENAGICKSWNPDIDLSQILPITIGDKGN